MNLDTLLDRPASRRCMRGVWLSAILTALTGCQGNGSPGATPTCQDLQAAQVAFIEYLWSHNQSALGKTAAAVFVALPDQMDPDRQFLDQLDGITTRVGPLSQSRTDDDGTVRDPATGDRALILRITGSRFTGQDEVEIRGGYEEANLSASRASYQLHCEADDWQVTAVGPMMISRAPQTAPGTNASG